MDRSNRSTRTPGIGMGDLKDFPLFPLHGLDDDFRCLFQNMVVGGEITPVVHEEAAS